LSAATSRQLQYALDGPATATFTLPGDHPQTALIEELECDLLVTRDDQPIFRGRVGTSADTLTADVHTTNFSAVDYRGMLDRRILWSDSPLSFRGVDQGLIAWQMIADTQAHPGGNWGVAQGSGVLTGVQRDRDYAPGQKIGEAVTQLGEVIGGFDWEIDAYLHFNVYYPARGRATGIDLVYGSQISGCNRTVTNTPFANAVRYSGDPSLQAVEISDTTFGPAGRWDAQIGNPDLKLQQSVSDAAQGSLAASDTLVPGYAVDLLEGWWNPADLWLGDSAALYIRSGRLNVAGDVMRVVGLTVTYADDGGEAVSVSLGDNPPSLTGRLGDYTSRLEVIERTLTAPSGYMLDAPVAAMFSWPGASPPQTWAWADGSAYSATHYPELFAVLGYTYGGSGDSFNLPDCRSRVLVAAGAGAGLSSRTAGQVGGAETVGLSGQQTGPHGHTVAINTSGANQGHNHGSTGTAGAAHTHGGTTGDDAPDHAHSYQTAQGSATQVPSSSGAWVASIPTNTLGATVRHQHPFTTGAGSADHSHATGANNVDHVHSVNGTTSTDGQGAGHENMPPWIAIGQIIRVLPPWRPTPI
jgi:microcystin-dependent protein